MVDNPRRDESGPKQAFRNRKAKMVNVAIVEDEKDAADNLVTFLKRYEKERRVRFSSTVFSNGLDFLNHRSGEYQLIFMDIQMPFMNGMEVSRKFREFDSKAVLIFVTNLASMAIKGYEVDAKAFMVKPIGYFSFESILDKAIKLIQENEVSTLTINSSDGIKKIAINSLLYVEVANHDLYYVTDGEEIHSRNTLRKIEKELVEKGFAKCSNCYLVNLAPVSEINGDTVRIGDDELKMSRSRKKSFTEAFVNCVGERL